MKNANPWRLAYIMADGFVGLIAPHNLRFATKGEALAMAERYDALPQPKRGDGQYIAARLDSHGYIVERSDKPGMVEHEHYNRERFPRFVCQNGNWHIYADAAGNCASIPTQDAAADGCKATHFGNLAYVQMTLGARIAS